MSISDFCTSERIKEEKLLKKFITYSVVGSVILHVGVILAASFLSAKPEVVEKPEDDPIELVEVEDLKPEAKEEQETETPPEPEAAPPPPQKTIAQEIPPPPPPQPQPVAKFEPPPPQPQPQPVAPPPPPQPQPQPVAPPPPQPQPVAAPPPRPTPRIQPPITTPLTSSLPQTTTVPSVPTLPSSPIISSAPPPKPAPIPTPTTPPPSTSYQFGCVSGCKPSYPTALDGAEGSAKIRVYVDQDGNVANTEIAQSSGNPLIDQEAQKAAQNMRFTKPLGGSKTGIVNITFQNP